MTQVDMVKKSEAVRRFVSLAGLDDAGAGKLVDAALQAAIDHALDTMMGPGPVPSALVAVRADQLRYVCLTFGRALTQREVGVLFRTTPSSARSILTTMTATYEEALHSQFLSEMKSDATVTRIGAADPGYKWQVTFTQESTYGTAVSELERQRVLNLATRIISKLTLEFDISKDDVDLLATLGLTPPSNVRTKRK